MENTVDELFKSITDGMLEVFKRKNADYGNSFDKSLDENGLIAAKVRMEDKMNRFGNLIKNPQKVSDESLEDTLLDLANYSIMTVMWKRGRDKQMIMESNSPSKQHTAGSYLEPLAVDDFVMYLDMLKKSPSVGKVSEVLTIPGARPEVKYRVNGALYVRTDLIKVNMPEHHELFAFKGGVK